MALRKMITIDEDLCTGCGDCVPSCEEGALAIVDGKAKLVKEIYCDGLGACLGDCPTGALKVTVREAQDFDPEAVVVHLKEQGRTVPEHMPSPESLRLDRRQKETPLGGCPGAALKTLTPSERSTSPISAPIGTMPQPGSALSHWPVQLRLVPPTAPFLKGADLLLTADCVPVACPDFHSKFLTGRVILMGCPKFDNQLEYIDKLAAILMENELKSITILEMEVPCCSAMSSLLAEAVKRVGTDVSTTRVTIARNGNVLGMVPLHFNAKN